ncbi:hypothetical protein G7Y89_g9096 [Cudoniella acicularis]|uniref:Uncharacterized protein n=1 Tax=Cudoniella acicularis TaxID=354080 RepID=A0A8H4W0F8_9HELO|nr:hypothetical protein G7Y89_g9096 [Cudoniella acicularis]
MAELDVFMKDYTELMKDVLQEMAYKRKLTSKLQSKDELVYHHLDQDRFKRATPVKKREPLDGNSDPAGLERTKRDYDFEKLQRKQLNKMKDGAARRKLRESLRPSDGPGKIWEGRKKLQEELARVTERNHNALLRIKEAE